MKKKQNPVLVPSFPSDIRTVPLHEEIATQAYTLWNHYGQPAGRDVSIWLEAERQVLGVDPRVNQQGGGAVAARPFSGAFTPEAPPPADQPELRGPR